MNLEGPFLVRLIFHGFVVVVGAVILAGAVNTAIVGSNGVLNRVSEAAYSATGFVSRSALWHQLPDHQHNRGAADHHHFISRGDVHSSQTCTPSV